MNQNLPRLNRGPREWPTQPYKGFSSYGPNDVPLFAGREPQVVDFARLVGEPNTQLVLLQGATGCGKSSFLRAGLIPFLEGRLRGFEFRKEKEEGRPSKAVFIRSTDEPLQKLAEETFKLACEGYSFTSPVGEEQVNLSEALFNETLMDDFTRRVINQPSSLVESLRIIAAALPVILVLIVDQGEEVLSLSSGRDVENRRAKYFQFLASFATSNFPLKLIIALRTDHFGVFYNNIRRRSSERMNIVDYLLENLGTSQLLEAIKRPTERRPVLDYPPPDYGFEFDEGLPERIVQDLSKTAEMGGLVGGNCRYCKWCVRRYTNRRRSVGDRGRLHRKTILSLGRSKHN